jgi:hypothetical protein
MLKSVLSRRLMRITDTLDIIEKLVNGQELDIDLAELGEIVLASDTNARHAQTILVFSRHPDKKAAWERFVSSSLRIYGPTWRDMPMMRSLISLTKSDLRPLACTTAGCMELAWGRHCDQCLARQRAEEGLV